MIGKPTIFAVSSGAGRAGIAVVRLSGPAVMDVFKALAGVCPEPRVARLRPITSNDRKDLIDVGLVLYFPAPHSVTGEDVGEFHIHGSPAVVERLLAELTAFPGCIPAEAGAFTRRAFENGRLDLVEVEGLADLLASDTEAQRRLAMRQFSGEASSIYAEWHQELTECLAVVEASIDFADEEGVAEAAILMLRPRLTTLKARLEAALQQSAQAAAVRQGLRIVIAGQPNVGKSSLLNALSGRDAAIVSEIAGTTRDVVEAAVVMNGVPVSLSDTAGLRASTDDAIERQGISRSHAEIAGADILVWVVAADSHDEAIPPRAPDLVVYNKADLEKISIRIRNDHELPVSTRSGVGLSGLREQLARLVSDRTSLGESGILVRARHRAAILESIRSLNDALAKPDAALELLAEDVRKAATSMATITGRVGVEDFLGKIFQEFCIGK